MPLSSVLGAQSLVRPGVCTSTTRPASPFEGQVIYETDTDLVQVYNGSGWKALGRMVASTNGSVLQVVSVTKTDGFITSSATNVDVTGVSLSITPTSTSSKVLVTVTGVAGHDTVDRVVILDLVRNSTKIGQSDDGYSLLGYENQANLATPFTISFLDSPSTTSATTYKLQTRAGASGSVAVGRTPFSTSLDSITTITAMEIAG